MRALENIIKVENLNVSYGKVPVVFDVNLVMNKGECVALLGPNGSGKTTIIRTICGLVKPSSGKIYFKGKEIQDLPVKERVKYGISVVPEGRSLFPYLTVTENLIISAFRPEAWKRRFELLEEVFQLFPPLKERKDNLASTLSGGEQQMLKIGRALMGLPEIILIDEPSAGLAPKVLRDVYDALKTLHEGGMTLLLAEQNVHYALKIAERGYLLREGRIFFEGDGEKLAKAEEIKKAYLGL